MESKTTNVLSEKSILAKNIIDAQKEGVDIKITKEVLIEKFGKLDGQITKFDNLSMNVEISNLEQLKINETHISTINKFLNDIDKVRKVFKHPYLEAGRKIDYHAKNLSTAFENSKKRLDAAVSSYKQIEVAKLKAEEESKRKEVEALLQKKNDEIEKLRRIRQQLVAKTYGGSFTLSSGEVKSTAGCVSSKDCENLKAFIKEKFPAPESFNYLAEESKELRAECLKMVSEHWANMLEVESQDEKVRFDAIERIKEIHFKTRVTSSSVISAANKEIDKEFKKDSNAISKEIREVGKGLRTVISFKVISEDDVPIDMKEVSEAKVGSYLRMNRDRILEMLRKNQQPIKGLHVYIEKNFVSR